MPQGAGAARRGGRILSIPLAIFAALTLGTASADAAVRYADPDGGAGPSCPQASPCDIQIAVEGAGAGDEVIITPGTYVETNRLEPFAPDLDIHGAPGVSKPTIQSSDTSGVIVSVNQRIADLRIEHDNFGGALVIANDAIAERMVAETTNGTACSGPYFGSTLRDSLCVATGPGGTGVGVSATDTETTGIVRNVTAVATGSSGAAITASAGIVVESSAHVGLDVRNTIALGPPTGEDVALSTTMGATADIDLHYSNYDTVDLIGNSTADPAGSPTNQTALPQLTAAYRELADSPTRDAGSLDSSSGTLDADGAQRVQGTAIDIGAYEFAESPPPADTTAPQTTISKGPKPKTKKRRATFVFSADEAGSTFTCKLDAKAAGPCASPLKLRRLKKGRHVLTVVATDPAGNADATAATYRWKVKRKRKKR